jgi:hypothetical protein
MTEDIKKKGVINRAITGISSITLLMYLLLFSLFLFPRLVICILVVATVPILFRFLPKFRQASQNES